MKIQIDDGGGCMTAGIRRIARMAIVFTALVTTGMIPVSTDSGQAPPVAVFHDNERPAGALEGEVRVLRLVAQKAMWHPYGPEESGLSLPTFAEVGEDPTIPAPYLVAELGQTVEVTIENTFDSTLVVYGLGERRSAPLEPWLVAPGATDTRRFVADAEGTFYYFARLGGEVVTPNRALQLIRTSEVFTTGAFTVQGPEMSEPIDEVMVMGVFQNPPLEYEVLTINGRPWPYTKRMHYAQGDTVRWRVINATTRGHPMHLHGFFFNVEALGDFDETEHFWPSQEPREVTVDLSREETMAIRWVAERPGGWVFHCHISFHVGENHKPLDQMVDDQARFESNMLGAPHHDPAHHVEQGMGGLMMALTIDPAPDWEPILEEPGTTVSPDSVQFPGSLLVFREGEPTSLWVVNRTNEATQIHWHGLEIESLFDGVVGVGGYEGMPTPPILPGDSFEVRYTAPRPGSYMYHTHMSDLRQQSAGMYGPIVVTPADTEWDPQTDHVFLTGLSPHARGLHVNGGRGELEPLSWTAGEAHRLRFMNIPLANTARYRLLQRPNGRVFFWRAAAKDGAELPPHRALRERAETIVRVGETRDVIVTLPPGEYALELLNGAGIHQATVPIVVTPPGG
jgi:FtsP/CotA-like multicopper oxidase with cupredoxin domain